MVTKGSVLVVDDEVNLCRIIGAKLARSGYSVVAVHDGAQAVEKVRESDFDIVLLDLILPGKDGLSALAEIRNVRGSLPVIVMTACESPDALEQARSYGVSAYLNKPFDLDNLVNLVATASQAQAGKQDRKLPESTILFTANQPVTLEIQNGSGSKLYLSRILAKDDRTLSVATPDNSAGVVVVAPRTSVKVGLAAKDAFYSFTTHVLTAEEAYVPLLVLEKPSVIYRIQRREHPRFDLRLPVRYAAYNEDSEDESAYKDGETRDLSVGGACIVVPDEILPGEMLRVEIRPKSADDVISTVACVMRSRHCDEPGQDGYSLGCRFVLAQDALEKLLKTQ